MTSRNATPAARRATSTEAASMASCIVAATAAESSVGDASSHHAHVQLFARPVHEGSGAASGRINLRVGASPGAVADA